MQTKKSTKVGLGVLLGAAAGAIAGLFLAPKAGKELRKDAQKLSKTVMSSANKYSKLLDKKTPDQIAKKVFGDLTESSTKLSQKVHSELRYEIAKLEKKYNTIDKKKYSSAVKTVVSSLKSEGKVPAATLKKLTSYLEKDARALVGKKKAAPKKVAARKPAKKATKKA